MTRTSTVASKRLVAEARVITSHVLLDIMVEAASSSIPSPGVFSDEHLS